MTKEYTKRVQECTDLIDKCRSSARDRIELYKQIDLITETGNDDGTKSRCARLFGYLYRLSAYLYSPVELKFSLAFENPHTKDIQAKAHRVAQLLTKEFAKTNADTQFGEAVFLAAKYGTAFIKQHCAFDTQGQVQLQSRIVPPWQLGVYREDVADLDKQDVIVESSYLTRQEVWRRIYNMPDAEKLLKRIMDQAEPGGANPTIRGIQRSIFFSNPGTMTGSPPATPLPGGIVDVSGRGRQSAPFPIVRAEMVPMHELWIREDDDWITEQIIEPDVLLTRFRRSNLLMGSIVKSNLQPFTQVQTCPVDSYLWGRSEICDLEQPQLMLSKFTDDLMRLYALQIDRLMAFPGMEGLQQEMFSQFRTSGFMPMPPGSSVEDLTPEIPPESLNVLKYLYDMIDNVGGFGNILSGQGVAGVRSGVHADTQLKTSSPFLRDKALRVERQLAEVADLRLRLMEAKDGSSYWTDDRDPFNSRFLLTDIPPDRMVQVDSHSSSPIFADDHKQLIVEGVKLGVVDPDYVIDALPFPEKDRLHQAYRDRQASDAAKFKELMQIDPELAAKALAKQQTGKR